MSNIKNEAKAVGRNCFPERLKPVRARMWGHMLSAQREPITGVWSKTPSEVQGQSPWSGGEAPETERFSALECPK